MDELRIGTIYEQLDHKSEEESTEEEKSRVYIIDISPKQENEYEI